MEARELRIGNYIYDNEVGLKGEFRVCAGDIKTIDDNQKEFDYSALPLTEEWLLKFGFTEYGEWFSNDWFYNGLNVSLKHKKTTIGNREETEIEHTKHVHQLQNLYFALTGEELIIK